MTRHWSATANVIRGQFHLQRYKGLGEMDAQQLWETTLDPETRMLKLVEIEDARMASEVTEMLMGTEVPPRRAFIYRNATDENWISDRDRIADIRKKN